jgi:myo-inositol 2-dehydrogenase/D-chiro-inositol 1-dehydrogenase
LEQLVTFRICLIGAGRIGSIHAANLVRHERVELAAIVDAQAAAAAALAARHGTQAASLEQALNDPSLSAVLIASSTDTHHDLIAACVRRGLPVLCEKPLDLDFARARDSVRRAHAAGVGLYLGFNRRFDPSFSRVHDELRSGRLGALEVLSITSRDPTPPPADYVRRSGGLFRDMMIHDLDMAVWLMGEAPAEVFASGACLAEPAIGEAGDIDTATVVMRTAAGRLCQITNSRRCSYGYDQRIEAFCAGGLIRADNDRRTRVEVATDGGFTREPALPFFLERYAEAYRLELDAFVRALDGEVTDLAGGEEALLSLALADAADRSLGSRAVERPRL